ncbi:MAG: hypothetical protein Q4A92_06580 [Corynebacterium sp.]|nr:hypothetical protein [Corynebacterium sp.]
MAGFEFDPVAAKAELDRLITDVDGRQEAFGQVPGFPELAAGRGFADYGRRIAQLLEGIHSAGVAHTNQLAQGVRDARDTITSLSQEDEDFGTGLRGLW